MKCSRAPERSASSAAPVYLRMNCRGSILPSSAASRSQASGPPGRRRPVLADGGERTSGAAGALVRPEHPHGAGRRGPSPAVGGASLARVSPKGGSLAHDPAAVPVAHEPAGRAPPVHRGDAVPAGLPRVHGQGVLALDRGDPAREPAPGALRKPKVSSVDRGTAPDAVRQRSR